MDSITINGYLIHFRSVYMYHLADTILVGSQEDKDRYIIDGTKVDDLFACYVAEDILANYSDEELRTYIEQEFYAEDYKDL